MNNLHGLLKRQLRRFADQTIPLLEEQTDFIRAINDAYWQFDADRTMLEHSLELTSQELLERNSELNRINSDLERRVAERTAELSVSEARFRGLFEHVPVSIWEEDFSAVRQYIDYLRDAGVVDFASYFNLHPEELAECGARVKIVDVNRATLEIYQAESKTELLTDLSNILGPDSLTQFQEELLALIRGDLLFETEIINYTVKVEKRIVFLRLTVAPGYEKTWAKVFVGISDVTERRQAEAALAAERDLLQALMDNIPDTIYFKDTFSRFTRINQAQAMVLGVAKPEDAIGKTDLDFQAPELAQQFLEEEQRLVQTGEALINRTEFNPTSGGHPRWFSATKVPIRDTEGSVIGIVGISRDITERKQAEEALQQSEERFKLIAWATKDAVWEWDLETKKIQWGVGLQKMFHYDTEMTETDSEWWLSHVHPEDRAKVKRSMDQALEGGMEFWSKEYRFQRKVGTYANIMDRGYILRNEQGNPIRMIGAMIDITDRKQAEETIRHQNEMLSSLHYITLNLLKYREVNKLLDALVEFSTAFLDATAAEIMLISDEALVVKATTKNRSSVVGQRLEREQAPLYWQAFDSHEPVVLSDYAGGPDRKVLWDEFSLHRVAVFPILTDNQCLGVLAVGRERPEHEFSSDQVQFGRFFANLTALVLNNAQLREALREQSIRDPLTGLFNRRYMEETLQRELSRAQRQHSPLAITMIDLDHFKQFNDNYGHAAGDALLERLGQLLQSQIREEDIACRYGGEEFLLIMPNASLEMTQKRAIQLRQAVRQLKIDTTEQPHNEVTLSMGVAIYPQHSDTAQSILQAADAALYRAKQEGRDRIVCAGINTHCSSS